MYRLVGRCAGTWNITNVNRYNWFNLVESGGENCLNSVVICFNFILFNKPEFNNSHVWKVPVYWPTSDQPSVYRSFSHADNIQLFNGARIEDGEVNETLSMRNILGVPVQRGQVSVSLNMSSGGGACTLPCMVGNPMDRMTDRNDWKHYLCRTVNVLF